eukprot:scaffold134922_cov21-Tisochrysis_lutea.AAC.2
MSAQSEGSGGDFDLSLSELSASQDDEELVIDAQAHRLGQEEGRVACCYCSHSFGASSYLIRADPHSTYNFLHPPKNSFTEKLHLRAPATRLPQKVRHTSY